MEDLTPRAVHEFMVGTAQQLGPNWSARAYGRHRRGSHFWEDTNNNARVAFNPPPEIPRELYIPDLPARLAQIGSGSSYVIAELDGAYSRYYEATVETEWRDTKTFVRGSFTWSNYYGNFDQDNSTTDNDLNIFIGSSNIADAAGRQLWDFKDGTLRGDRPALLKLYGYREFDWNGSFGLFTVFQSGQPWERWSLEPYRTLTTSTVETNRYAEKAGSRRSDSHYPGGPQLHAELQGRRPGHVPAHGGHVQRLRQADRLQHRAAQPQLGIRHAAAVLRPAALPAGGALHVLEQAAVLFRSPLKGAIGTAALSRSVPSWWGPHGPSPPRFAATVGSRSSTLT